MLNISTHVLLPYVVLLLVTLGQEWLFVYLVDFFQTYELHKTSNPMQFKTLHLNQPSCMLDVHDH